MLTEFANTLSALKSWILAYYDHHITSASIEGTINKIKTMKIEAYGYRDLDLFKLRTLAIHQARSALTG